MQRKIVKQGSATMTISLPSKWIKSHNLNEGDELHLEEQKNSITLSTKKETSNQSITIDTTKYGFFTKNDLSHFYFLGYDEIKVLFSDQSILKEIKERVPDCIGYEIVDQKKDSITIKAVTSGLDEFDVMLKKVFQMIEEMGSEIHNTLHLKNKEKLSQIRELEAINNRFTSFLLRDLSKKGYKVQNRTLQAYDMVQNLERIADQYKYICDAHTNIKKVPNKKTLELLKQVNKYYVDLYYCFFSYSPQKRMQLYKERKPLVKKIEKEFTNEPLLCHHLLSLIEKIYTLGGSCFALLKH